MQIPTLNIWFRKYNEEGNPVRGHAARCYSIAHEWRKRGGKVSYFPREIPIKSISLSDGVYTILTYLTDMSVSIKDRPEEVENKANILVCHNPGAEFEDWNFGGVKLLGPKYFIRRPEYNHIFEEDNTLHKRKYIALIPGGNKRKFFSQVKVDKLDSLYVIVDYFSPAKAAEIISKSSAVICSASVTAMEAMSLGKPTWIVQTAEDQELLYKWLPVLGAIDWSRDSDIDYLLKYERDGYLREKAYRSQLSIPSDGTQRVVDRILEEWGRRQ